MGKRTKHPIEQFMGKPGEELKIVQVIEERDVEALELVGSLCHESVCALWSQRT
jgi:hypothetical protein